jgi:hypothetical protein
MPEPLAWQFQHGGGLWESLGWNPADAGDLEADDLMATLAAQEQTQAGTALILTGDRDLLQCVTESVRVLLLKPGKGTVEMGHWTVLRGKSAGQSWCCLGRTLASPETSRRVPGAGRAGTIRPATPTQ